MRRLQRMRKTLNTSDSNCQQLTFPESCGFAKAHGFDAVNLDLDCLREHGAEKIARMLKQHGLAPGVFAFQCTIDTTGADDDAFAVELQQFMAEAGLAAQAGYTTATMRLLPFSDSEPFGPHFRNAVARLGSVVPVLREHSLRLALEFFGPFRSRRTHRYDFLHTVEGIRSLAAAAGAEDCVGIKLDVHHLWCTSGGALDELIRLDRNAIGYVELNDSHAAYDRICQPESDRDVPGTCGTSGLPGTWGTSDAAGLLRVLAEIGYEGPVAVEPFTRRLHKVPAERGVREMKAAMDRCFDRAARLRLSEHLVGTQPCVADSHMPSGREGGEREEARSVPRDRRETARAQRGVPRDIGAPP